MELSDKEKNRYARHIVLNEVGAEGQKKLLNAKVLVIGVGGLGSPAAMYLASSGVGTIGIADSDSVDLSNLQRQIIHTSRDAGREKVISAQEKMKAINPDINVNIHRIFVNADNIMDLIDDYDFIIDATDNFDSKFLINDACVAAKKPFSHAGVIRFNGQTMTYLPGKGPCYRCIFEAAPPKAVTCREVGVMGAACGVIGSIQAMEAIKYIMGIGELLNGYLLTYDALSMNFRKIKLPERVKNCPVCSHN